MLLDILKKPQIITNFSIDEWNDFISQAYASKLLGRLYKVFEAEQLLQCIPEKLLWHFESAYQLSLTHSRDVRNEILYIRRALKLAGLRTVFLKGAAYEISGDEVAVGRVYSDIDIFVPKTNLASAESVLLWNGWIKGDINAYDESYYRNWMHEIPPLTHKIRGTTLDVHHNLSPLSARFKIDSELLSCAVEDDSECLGVNDRILHCIVHLFMETEFDKGIRDLSDIDMLLRQHINDSKSLWNDLTARAAELGMGRLYFYGVRYASKLLGTYVPASVLIDLEQKFAPNKILLAFMDRVFVRAFSQPCFLTHTFKSQLATTVIFIRGHWLKMPMHILIYHSVKKGFSQLNNLLTGKSNKKTPLPINQP